MIVLDTNVISEMGLDRPDPKVAEWAARFEPGVFFLCVPVVAELAFGAARVMLRDRNSRHWNALNLLIERRFRGRILSNDIPSALKYGEIFAARQAMGRPVGPMDAMIAAICLVNDATLATRNVRDFDGLGMKLVNPFEAEA